MGGKNEYRLPRGKEALMGGLRDKGKARPSEALLSAEEVALYFGVKPTTV